MIQTAIDFQHTRSRRTDGATSRDAAKAAISLKSARERIAIVAAVKASPSGLTAYEVADQIGVDRQETSRRISECGLVKTDMRRGGCFVWMAVFSASETEANTTPIAPYQTEQSGFVGHGAVEGGVLE